MKKPILYGSHALTFIKIAVLQILIVAGTTGVTAASPLESNDQGVLDKMLSISAENKKLGYVLSRIEKLAQVKFSFNPKTVPIEEKVSVNSTNAKLSEVLGDLLKPFKIDYEVLGEYIILMANDPLTNALPADAFLGEAAVDIPAAEVTGTVRSEAGESMPGVNVLEKGTANGTTTDADGRYTLSVVNEGAVLVFSFIGFATQEVSLSGRSVIDVTLAEDVHRLDEVVVVGYGTQQRKEVTSSIASVKEDAFLKGPVYQSPLQLISGRVAGMALSRSRGGDPTSGVQIQLRGVSSVRGNTAPLVVIDGIPGGDLNSIAPENIASIDVLRDGSAAAIYGTRANAGVIIITTKKGATGAAQVEYSSYIYTERYANKPEMLTGEEWRHYKDVLMNSNDVFLVEKGTSMIDYGHNTDWFEVISQHALSQVHNLSISGGSESTTYYGSLNYRDQKGLVKKTSNNVMGGRLSLTHRQFDDKLVINMNISTTFITSHPHDDEIFTQAIMQNPTLPVYNKDRRPTDIAYNPDGLYYEEAGYANPNPLGLIEQFHRDNQGNRFLGNVKVAYEIIPGLEASVMGAYQQSNQLNGFYEERDSWSAWTATQYYGVASRSASKGSDRTLETILNYSKALSGGHNLSAMAGYSYQDFVDENFSAGNRYFLSDAFTYNNLGAGLHVSRGLYASPVSSSKSSSKLIAFFGRANYNFEDKYLFSASVRREGSSKFGANNKWGYFPAVSAGWTISSESFMDNVNFIDNLKLRVGYGVTGNQGISDYLSLPRMATRGVMLYNGQWIPGFAPASNPNPGLRWEKKAESNIGVDLDIFNNITVNIDLYNRKTTDLLYEYAVPVPPNLYNTTWSNVGEMSNKGIEFTITATPVSKSKFSWTTNFNISYNKNELVSLSNELYSHSYLMLPMPNAGRLGQSDETIYRVEEGLPIGNIYGWEHAGIGEDGKWQVWDETNTNKIHPTAATFEDRRVIGNGLPKSWFGLNNRFAYGNFDLDISIRGALFFDVLNSIALHKSQPGTLPGQTMLTTFTDPEIFQLRDTRNYMTSYFVERGDYAKLDNITLGYNIPLKAIKQLRVYVSGGNLFMLTNYKGQDPEMEIQGLTPGYDEYWGYPQVKTFAFGLNAKF